MLPLQWQVLPVRALLLDCLSNGHGKPFVGPWGPPRNSTDLSSHALCTAVYRAVYRAPNRGGRNIAQCMPHTVAAPLPQQIYGGLVLNRPILPNCP